MHQKIDVIRGVFMKIGALLAILLLLSATLFSETYSNSYSLGGYLQVTRTVETGLSGSCPLMPQGISDACAHSGANQASLNSTKATRVTLSVKNIGEQGRNGLSISESLSFVPTGTEISFSPQPSQFDGRQSVWEIPSLNMGETRNLTYEFDADVSEAAVGRIPDVAVAAEPPAGVLYAPSRLLINGTLTLTLKTPEGRPISGAKIAVGYPDGSVQLVRTGITGTASLVASRKGVYTYLVEGYTLSQIVSTLVDDKAAEAQSPVVASAADAGIFSGIIGVLPIFAAVFALAVVVLIAYNFLTARREEEDSYSPAPQLAEQQEQQKQGVSYTQNFSFGTEERRDTEIDDATRSILENRKRRMQEAEQEPPEGSEVEAQEEIYADEEKPAEEKAVEQEETSKPEEAAAPEQPEQSMAEEKENADSSEAEREIAGLEMDAEISELERHARIAGEVAEQEKEVENMLTQLEEIRNKLRAGRGAPQKGAEEEMDDTLPEASPKPAAPDTKRKMAKPASKKIARGKKGGR
jgi:hypothetical protein